MPSGPENAGIIEGDEIDLRFLVEVLLKARWLIAGVTLAGIFLAGLLSYVVLTPIYEATLIVTLPPAQGQSTGTIRLGMSPQAYKEFATSLPVMEATLERVASRLTFEQAAASLRDRFKTSLNGTPGLLEVTATGHTAEEAHLLATAWQAAYQEAVLTYIHDQLATSLHTAAEQVRQVEAEFTQAQEALAAFDRAHGLSLLQARLEQLERDLMASESRLRALTMDLLPTERARLQFLQAALANEPASLEVSVGQAYVPDSIPGGTVINPVTVLNPAYLQYSEDLAATGGRIAAYEAEAAALQEKMSTLPGEVARLRAELLRLETERDQLILQRDSARARLAEAIQGRDALSPVAARLQDLARVEVVSPAIVPAAPVSPRPVLNIAVAAVLAFFASMFFVFIRQWWTGPTQANLAAAR